MELVLESERYAIEKYDRLAIKYHVKDLVTHEILKTHAFGNLGGVQVVQLDYNNPDALAAAFKDVEKLFLPRFNPIW